VQADCSPLVSRRKASVRVRVGETHPMQVSSPVQIEEITTKSWDSTSEPNLPVDHIHLVFYANSLVKFTGPQHVPYKPPIPAAGTA
jgi:hypothetical protein